MIMIEIDYDRFRRGIPKPGQLQSQDAMGLGTKNRQKQTAETERGIEKSPSRSGE
jgi:hypothetical protein